MSIQRTTAAILTIAAALLAAPTLVAQGATPADHGFFAPTEIQWADGPPSVPAGAKLAVLKGDPKKEELFVIRLKLPAGYKIMPHWHPAVENVTVISGAANLGMGETFDKSKGHKIPTGGFATMAATTRHFFWVDEDTVIQLHGMGPWQLYYLNPADDPRTAPKK